MRIISGRLMIMFFHGSKEVLVASLLLFRTTLSILYIIIRRSIFAANNNIEYGVSF